MVEPKLEAEGFYDQIVVFALGQAGDGYAADDACSGDLQREAAAVGGVFRIGQSVFFGERCVVVLQVKAELVGAAVEAGYYVRFAFNPAGVVGRGAGERGVEERLVRVAEAADIDDDGVAAGDRQLAEGEAQSPCSFCVEGGQDQLCFLADDSGEIVCDGHVFFPCRVLRGDILAEQKYLSLQPFYMRGRVWLLIRCPGVAAWFVAACGLRE